MATMMLARKPHVARRSLLFLVIAVTNLGAVSYVSAQSIIPTAPTPSDRTTLINQLLTQVAILQQKIAELKAAQGVVTPSTSSTAPVCTLNRTLMVGARGTDVSCLQQFLIAQNLLAPDSATGYYGPLTRSAVQQWQARQGIVSSGMPQTTGWGVVGPRTRALLRMFPTSLAAPIPGYNMGGGGTTGGGSQGGGGSGTMIGGSTDGGISSGRGGDSSGGGGGGGQPLPPARVSCTLDGVTLADGASQLFYSTTTIAYPKTCTAISLSRTCHNGTLDGDRVHDRVSCTVTGSGDTTPPSTPTNLSGTVISSSQINLTWNASADSIGVTGYKVFRNGTQVGTPTGTSYSDNGLIPKTVYTYAVSAYDAAGNPSTQSSSVSATTLKSLPAVQFWLGPDFVGGNGTGKNINPGLKALTTDPAYWKDVIPNTDVFEIRIGALTEIFNSDCSIAPTAEKSGTSMADIQKLAQNLNTAGIPVSVSVGGFRAFSWLAPQMTRVEAGRVYAAYEYPRLACWIKAGGRIDYLVLDNPISWGINYQTGYQIKLVEFKEKLDESALLDAVADYMVYMRNKIPGVRFGWTEYLGVVEVPASGRTFPGDPGMATAYNNFFTTADMNFSLTYLLDEMKKRTSAKGVSIETFFLDFTLEKDAIDGGMPLQRLLTAESIVRGRGMKVGVYMAQWESPPRVPCTGDYISCTQYLRNATGTYNGTNFALITEAAGRLMLERDTQQRTLAYVNQYKSLGGKPDVFIYETWQHYPETMGPQGTIYSFMNTAFKLGNIVHP